MALTLRWLLPSLVPLALFVLLVRRGARGRDATGWLIAIFCFGLLTGGAAMFLTTRAEALTSLDLRVATAGPTGALIFAFLVMAPLHEAAKVAAAWPAFLTHHFDDAADGVLYAAAAALGFAAVDTASVLRANQEGAVWIARVLLALPANVFIASLWGYALSRAKRSRRGLPIFPSAFVVAVAVHGLYEHLVYGRGPGALLAVLPMLALMGLVTWWVARDLRARGAPSSAVPSGSLERFPRPPSLVAVQDALQRADEPIRFGWILLGALVTLGAMIAGVAAGVAAAHVLHVDLSTVDEEDVASATPALLLAAGLLGAFPVSGWLIARAASVHSLLEPALATVLALVVTLATLGVVAPFSVVFALALSPVAWVLACAGAWTAL